MSKILVTGSLAYDYTMRFRDLFSNHILPDKLEILNVSFTADEMSKHFGGTAGNIAYSLGLLGERPVVFATVGKDFGEYAQWLEKNGVDSSEIHVHQDTWTASAHIITDARDNQLTAFYGGAMLKNDIPISPVLGRHPVAMAIIAADGKDGMLRHARELKEKGIPCVYDPGHSIPSCNRGELRSLLAGSALLIVNDYEENLFCEKAGLTREEVLSEVRHLIVTRKEQGSTIYCGDRRVDIPAAKATQVVNPTGAGDSYRAGLLKGLLKNAPIEICARLASVAACYKVEYPATQGFHYTTAEFIERYRSNYGKEGELPRIFENRANA